MASQPVRGAPVRLTKRENDRSQVGNIILRGLPPAEWALLFPTLEFVRLRLHQVLHEAGEAIKSGYFLNDGMSSVLTVQPDGESVEVGLIGREGFVGLPAIFGFKTSALRIITQGDGTAYRVEVGILRGLLSHCPALERHLQQYSMILGIQSTQLAACNRLHDVEERLARWLLMSHDRIGSKTLPLTQEFLAQMLGTRRSTVSVAAGVLQKAGMISYTRGHVTILNKSRLEEAACDCYEIIRLQRNRWQAETA
jgi:CRP-like cAMP-binding protein